MEAVKTKKKTKKKKWVVLVIIVVIIGILLGACVGLKKAAEAKLAAMNAMQTEEVTVRALTKSIGATGTVISIRSRDLVTTLSGMEVEQVHVEVGDTVQAGQPLVQFNTEDIAQNLAAAQNALTQTEGQYDISSENARRQVDDAVRGGDYQIRMAYNNVESAWLAYSNACDSLAQLEQTEQEAYDVWVQAEETYNAAVKELEEAAAETVKDGFEIQWNGETYTISQEQLEEVLTVLQTMGIDISQVSQLSDTITQLASACVQAEAAYDQARSARQTMQNNVDNLYIAYENAVITYENTVASAGSSVAAAEAAQESTELSANTDQQQIQIDTLSDQIKEGTVTAPFAGIVTAVNVKQGDTYLQGAIVTIQDCSSYEIEAQIGEYDIADVKLGQKVLIKTDSTRDQELEGTVVFISPTATTVADVMSGVQTVSGDPTYKIRISVDTPSDRLRLDMSASLSIIIDQHENAMTVPYNAVQVAEDGSTFVEVVGADGETLTVVPVEVVMESSYYTEIAGDLKEGDVVRVVAQETSDMFSVMTEMGEGGF